MNIKTNGMALAVAFGLLLASLSSIGNAHDLWTSQHENTQYLGNANQCTAIKFFTSGVIVAEETPKPAQEMADKYAWPPKYGKDKDRCDELKAAAGALPVKIWRVAVNPRYPDNKTRPVKNIIEWKTLKTPRAIIGETCGKEVKYYNSRYSYREIVINTVVFAVICE